MATPLMNSQNIEASLAQGAERAAAAETSGAREARRAGRIGLWALAVGFGGFLLWAGLAPLDEGVPGQGLVTLDTKRKAVQHLSGGIVKEVLVHEGAEVKEGQLLIRLDEAMARANYESARQRYLGLRAMQGRLQAEQTGAAKVSFHPDLEKAAADPLIRQQMFNQEQLFLTRRSLLRSDLQSIEESIQGQQGLLEAYVGMLTNRKQPAGAGGRGTGQPARPGQGGLCAAQPATRTRAHGGGRTFGDRRHPGQYGACAARHRRAAPARHLAPAGLPREVDTQLADVSREVLSEEQKFKALSDDLGRTEIKAPAAGQVVGLAVQTVGGVVAPGQKLMDIVPGNEALLLEVQVAPHLIDRVHADLPVDVRFNSFAHSPQLVVAGQVVSVSGDLLTDPHSGISYYLARVQSRPRA
jgi:protease secretion system membrane fusion protein